MPKKANPHCHRAFALTQLKKFNEALNDTETAIQLDKNYNRSYCYRGYILMKLAEVYIINKKKI